MSREENDLSFENDDDESSDIEIEGIDQDNDEEEEGDDEEDMMSVSSNHGEKHDSTADDGNAISLVNEDLKEQEEARRERLELIAAEQKALAEAGTKTNTVEDRLGYLVSQSEVFAHFLAGSVAATGVGKKAKSKGRSGKVGRLTEVEEDAQLLKSATSKRRTIRLDTQPSILASHCNMHSYQLEGLNWLIKLHDHGINGILADEMGLGKTLQTISLLAYLRQSRGVHGPHLVVVPKSVVGNWIREFKKWCPSIHAIRMGGAKEERKKILVEHLQPSAKSSTLTFDVLVTSYEGVLKEKGAISKFDWKYLIIDEAHRIKNENSSLSQAVRTINTDFRLLITGTPLQNNLHELWALLNFLLPDIFSNAEQFDEWFSLEDEHAQQNVIKRLHTVLRPFMIRRVKKDVACALPPKKETKLYVGLTPMQQDWYKKILRKEAFELNSLGGPDKVRLLNIVMQLRKVCNHPYLFDGAEPGPPYIDGPHLWETSGKMALLHKLLIKLKQKGSRVLIFSQMTRVLDILEDYMRLMAYQYCRIDGNTDGEKRDTQMDEFNAPDSPKFCFLLSTRAGGLGINLATADIVILFDSDWNPQVDLQAMDRAHRIGQTKPVQVFRFIAEGTIDEKVIERADRKLFLDAAVIQQGRLAQTHSQLEKDELMRMVKFGADEILSGTGGTYTDEDIDALIARGEERTSAMQAKIQTDAQHNLASFSLVGDDGERDTFQFGDENFRESDKRDTGAFINLPQRERKRIYDIDAFSNLGTNEAKGDAGTKKRRKIPKYQDFQFFNVERLEQIEEKERQLAINKEIELNKIKSLREAAKTAPTLHNTRFSIPQGQSREELNDRANTEELALNSIALSKEEVDEKEKLLAEGFSDWSKKDFRVFCASLERHGRYGVANIVKDVTKDCGKSDVDVKRYYISFWMNYKKIGDWRKILDKVEKQEKIKLRLRQIRDCIHEKIERHCESIYSQLSATSGKSFESLSSSDLIDHCWQTLKLNYGPGTGRNRAYMDEEDAFLLCMMHRHGYGNVERIRMEIIRSGHFRFNWYFKSRNVQEIRKRCDIIVKIVEKEIEDLRKKEQEEAQKQNQNDSNETQGIET
jgi:SWI/SNF-related matrix-associated actin-dependent regulator of chromatin subfamily A member 5